MKKRIRNLVLAVSGMALSAGLLTAAPANAIIGGEDATGDNRVVFVWSWLGTNYGACSGVPIAPKVVLTAAHCINVENQLGTGYQRNTPTNVFVSQPGVNMRTAPGIQVRQIFYPDCNQITGADPDFVCDLAALVLSSPVSSVGIDRLGTVTDLETAIATSAEVVALGYGKTLWNWTTSPTPRKVTLTVARPGRALTPLGQASWSFPAWFPVDETTKGTCGGDSGGPLVQVIDGKSVLLGLTSWGFACAGNPFQTIPFGWYTNVTAGVSFGKAISEALAAAAAS